MIYENFIQSIRATKNLSEKTLKAYRSDLQDFERTFSRIETVTLTSLFDYIDELKSRGLKDSSIKRRLITVKQFLDYLCRQNALSSNPMREISFPYKREHALPKTLTIREVTSLIATINTDLENAHTDFAVFQAVRDMCFIDILISTGIRIGEAAALSVDDIIFPEHTILIHGKGRKQRLIYISCQDTWNHLKDWLKLRKALGVTCPYVFVNRHHTQMSIYGLENIFYKYRAEANINPHSTPHFLRHTFATNLLANGADLRSVQEIMGHASISTTEIYTEVTITRKKKVLSKYNYRNKMIL